MVTVTKSRYLSDGDVQACASFADSPASTLCFYKCTARLTRGKKVTATKSR